MVEPQPSNRLHQCGADTIDHILPPSLGGSDDLDNLRPALGRKRKIALVISHASDHRPSNTIKTSGSMNQVCSLLMTRSKENWDQ
jgi:5-methylcytosine-specific restriction endonuclease McrA